MESEKLDLIVMKRIWSLILTLLVFGLPYSLLCAQSAAEDAEPTEAAEGLFSDLTPVLDVKISDYTVGDFVLSFGIILLTLIIRNILTRFIFARLKGLASRTKMEYDDSILEALEKPVSLFFLFLGLYLSVLVFPIEPETLQLFSVVFRGATTLLVFWGILRLTDVAADVMTDVTKAKGDSIYTFIPLIKKAVRVTIMVLGVIMVIDNLGYSVGGILATLGLGGAAFAFAAKDSIANLYGSLALALDRPFKVGDWIMVGDTVDGDVEEIGLRSTKVRTWPKTVLSIPNNIIANEIINNWSRMPKRRVKQVVGVTYESSADDMAGIVEDIKKLLKEDEGVDQDFILVSFTDFGESSLNILVYYFTASTAWLEHMAVRERVNQNIMKAVEARGLSIAFPTRTVYFEGDIAKGMAGEEKLPGDVGPKEPY